MSNDSSAPPKPGRKIVRGWEGAKRKTGKSRVQLWRDVRDNHFPPPISLGPNSVGWFEDAIDEWLASRPRRSYATPAAA
jgi:predicted DNA-binding transcriptional regulator AlpA